jgi:HK97 family phage portal protein
MADNKSRIGRFVDYLNQPTQRQQQKYSRYNQQTSLDRAVYGYNTDAGYWPVSELDDIGDGSNNSAVVACLNVLTTSFAEPKNIVIDDEAEYGNDRIKNHPVLKLLNRPNPFTSGVLMAHYIVTALSAYGDAYLYKNRNVDGNVVELVPLMPNMVEPKGDENTLITHFKYSPYGGLGGNSIIVPTNDIVHIRQGIDPNNHRRGFAPLKSVLREILGDEAAGQYAAALLHNMAVPGVILSPKDDSMGGPSKEEAEAISAMYKQKFGGKNRGAPMILSGAMNVEVVSFSPDQMNLTELRKLPEERVSAVLGVPAILAGLGAGLDAATYNNTRELREFFTEQKLVPLWKSVASELTHQLLRKDYEAEGLSIKYDLEDVRALSQDKDDLYKRMNTAVQGGWITIGEARKAVGLDVDDSHEVYLRPMNMIETAPGQNNIPQEEQETEPVQEDPVLQIAKQLIDKVLTTGGASVDSTRSPVVKPTPTYLDEEEMKYVAEMPNGAWCILDHDTNDVIECFSSESEARDELERMKKDVKAPKKTNFPSSGDNQTISISNSKFKQFPDYNYVKDLKENWPEIWRRAGTGGNPPTSFTGNDAFNRWTKYRSGDRSESVLNWVKRRESFMARHSGNTKLNGYIAVMKWGGVTKTGVSAMKKTVNEYKKVVRERRKIQEELLAEIESKALSQVVKDSLKKKVEDHNAKNPKYRATLRMLTASYNRGLAAYQNNPGSVRGNVSSPQQWAMARVNGLLTALRTGKFKRTAYDTDLLPSNHPLSSKKNNENIIEEINVSTEEAEALFEVEFESARSEKAPAGSIKKGDAVSWSINKDPQPASTANGIVTSVATSGSISVGQEKMDATPEKPIAKIKVWAINEDGSRTETDRSVIQPVSKLRKISDFR